MNYHIHSNYSPDGEMMIEDACRKAIELGIEEIAFTDHIDIDWPDPDISFDRFDIDRYMVEIDKNRNKYKGQLQIKSGIEVGLQPHVLKETTEIVKNYPFDFVIASIHIIQGEDPYRGDYYKNRTKEESFRLYYEETLDLIEKFTEFDVLGHIGYIKRYSPFSHDKYDELLCINLIEDILKIIIKKGKGIEVNTSGYRQMPKCPMPPFEVIKRYKELGGEIITLGSDAHNLEDIGFGLEAGLKTIKQSGFKTLTSYTGRKPSFIPIP